MTKRAAIVLSAIAVLAGCGDAEPPTAGAPPELRRLTDSQYKNAIADIFGEDIVVGGGFDPLPRTDGLEALSARKVRITPSGLERYVREANGIAAQVLAESRRETLLPCAPVDPAASDESCATAIFTHLGRLLYRRPLTDAETRVFVTAAGGVAGRLGDFHAGIRIALARMLSTPEFLFIADATEADPAGGVRLTGHAKAARLSFLMWDSTPDAALLDAADAGALHNSESLEREVSRLMASPKFETGLRAFFTDFLDLRKFETLDKDPVIYPTFTLELADAAREQLMRTILDHVATGDRDYRDLYTTQQTVLNRSLGRLYRVSVSQTNGAWTPYQFDADDQRAGILGLPGFLALHSHPGRSSPTLRGKAIRELVMCQKVPDPPSDVDFTLFNDPNSPSRTARERLTAHMSAPSCAGCHRVTDPIGLGFENFDGAGQFRTAENDTLIDTTGDLSGVAFTDAVTLATAIRNDPATPACLVNRLYSYGVGRPPTGDERAMIGYLEAAFAGHGFKIKALLRDLALSRAFFRVSPAQSAAIASTEERS